MSTRTHPAAHPEQPAPAPEEIDAYRAALASLMERCLERIRRTPIPFEAEPLESWRTDD